MRSAPARSWSSTARRTASRTASSRSSAPNNSGWLATSSQNLAYQPGNAQLPMTVAGIRGRLDMEEIYEFGTAAKNDKYRIAVGKLSEAFVASSQCEKIAYVEDR